MSSSKHKQRQAEKQRLRRKKRQKAARTGAKQGGFLPAEYTRNYLRRMIDQ